MQFKKKNTFDPMPNQATIKTFMRSVQKETTDHLGITHPHHSNCSKQDREIIKSLAIRSADKGGGIQDYSKYRLEILHQLSDSDTYLKLNGDPTIQVKRLIETTLQKGLEQEFLDQDFWEFLQQSNPRTPVIYILPKIHKSLQDPPGRPIVSAVGAILDPLAR
ncbi:Hypothetical predicted protein [Pelobates cultripes]|uniref:Uncharacterized protein n=1 Tax=Pelobates cultripes TaxID=61616 RepID=A0AAD1VVL2_PELCU|nr:Hypothetical predicted protein [Pelobates cultripes]